MCCMCICRSVLLARGSAVDIIEGIADRCQSETAPVVRGRALLAGSSSLPWPNNMRSSLVRAPSADLSQVGDATCLSPLLHKCCQVEEDVLLWEGVQSGLLVSCVGDTCPACYDTSGSRGCFCTHRQCVHASCFCPDPITVADSLLCVRNQGDTRNCHVGKNDSSCGGCAFSTFGVLLCSSN